MEFHGFVRNEEIFADAQKDYPEWIPAQLLASMDRQPQPRGSHWFMVRCTHQPTNLSYINFTAGRFYLRASKRSRVSRAKLLLMLEAC